LMQVYLQNSKLEDRSDTEINMWLDRLLELSNFYADHWMELPNLPPDSIRPGTKHLVTSAEDVWLLSWFCYSTSA